MRPSHSRSPSADDIARITASWAVSLRIAVGERVEASTATCLPMTTRSTKDTKEAKGGFVSRVLSLMVY